MTPCCGRCKIWTCNTLLNVSTAWVAAGFRFLLLKWAVVLHTACLSPCREGLNFNFLISGKHNEGLLHSTLCDTVFPCYVHDPKFHTKMLGRRRI